MLSNIKPLLAVAYIAAASAGNRLRPHCFGAKVVASCFLGEPLPPRSFRLHCVPISDTWPSSAFAYLSLNLGVVV